MKLTFILTLDLLLFRNFPNVAKGANLTIFIVLKTIEEWKQKHNGRYPQEIFLQIDGGAENANKYLLGCLEFLVARGVVSSIYYTRLPVGHTHEDIDACFGLLWNWFKKKTIHHPDEYKKELEDAMKDSNIPTIVIDIFSVPDYKIFFAPFIDKNLSRLYREEDTKLQWHFQLVKTSERFPLGVKTMYRSYASDQVVMLKQVTSSQAVTEIGRLTGLEPFTVLVRWEPASDNPINSGMIILTEMPVLDPDKTPTLPFTDFAVDGISSIYSTVTSCSLEWSYVNNPEINTAWMKWQKLNFPALLETAGEYAIRRRITSPMPMLFKKDYIILKNNHQSNSTDHIEGSYTFAWPSNVAYANASVVCSSNLHPPAPLTFTNFADNGIHDEPINRFLQNTRPYYDLIVSGFMQIKHLDNILCRKMKTNGDCIPTQGKNKRDKVEIIINWDAGVIRNRFQKLSDTMLAFIENLFAGNDIYGNAIRNSNRVDINDCRTFHRIYIPIYSNTFSALVVIDIVAHSIIYYNPFVAYDSQNQIECANIRDKLQTVLFSLCESINGDNLVRWEISVSPKWVNGVLYYSVLSGSNRHEAGLYLMIFLEYLYHDLPLYFSNDDVAYYRKQFCFNIANKCIPNM